jgi:hypothetical protein
MYYLHRAIRERSLFFIFFGGFTVSVALACWTGWNVWVSNQEALHQPATWFGNSGYIWSFLLVILSNISSNLFGQSLVIILTAYFIYRRSAESRDEEDSVESQAEATYERVLGRPAPRLEPEPGVRGFWHDHSLGVLFLAGFLLFLGLQTWTGWVSYQAGQTAVHQSATFGSFLISDWGYNTWQNWQADLFGPAVQLVLARHFIYRGSSQSREGQEHVKSLLSAILRERPEPATS